MNSNGHTTHAAAAIAEEFDAYDARFQTITRRARERFERCEWHEAQEDARERLALYKQHVDRGLVAVRQALGEHGGDVDAWQEVKWFYSALIAEREDCELAETFFNSITRRIFATVGVNPRVEYVLAGTVPPPDIGTERPIARCYRRDGDTTALVRRILGDHPWRAPWRDRDDDARRVGARIDAAVIEAWGAGDFIADVLVPPFFRNKGAYLVGRLRRGERVLPLVLPLLNDEYGIHVDAAVLTVDEASIVFGFSWSYFLVDTPRPRATVDFLASIMPHKRRDELYNSIGYNKHGKTELYRAIVEHLAVPEARFGFAEGDQGLVMSVFTLPSLNVVFKVIKDHFGAPKRTTRKDVREKYYLVFVRDRVGRLADAQEFEHLEFPRERFAPELLDHLCAVAASTVHVRDDRVVIRHLYTERRVVPLNLHLRESDAAAARDAILDYGCAIKDLAAADIFTGDMLLKNFGVTRHGRVIFYDYDELTLLTECNFRRIPRAASLDDELASEPWFYVGEHDVFPEEFRAFMVPAGPLRDAFMAAHRDLLTVEWWQHMQARIRAGELPDIFPYRDSSRLARGA